MIVELLLATVIGVGVAWKFRSKIAEDVVKKLQKKEQTRDIQLLTDSLTSLKKIWELTEGVCHWAKQKDLFIKQHQDLMKQKNDLIDSFKKQIEDPMTVLDKELKEKIITALQKSRFSPATTALEPHLVSLRQNKILENGGFRESPDFNVNEKLVDNGCDEALKSLTEVIDEIKNMIKSD